MLAGVLYASPAGADVILKSSMTSGLTYDSNAAITTREEGRVDDFIFRVTPQLDLLNERKNATISALYSLSGAFYFDHPELNTISHRASVNAGMSPTPKLGLELNDSFAYTKDALETSPSGVQLERASVMSNTVSAMASYQLTERASASLHASNNITEFSREAATDSRVDTAGVSARYAATPSTFLNGSYSYSNFTFRSSSTSSHSALLGFTQQFPYELDLSLSAGTSWSPELSDKYNWLAAAALTKRFKNASASLEYARQITDSSGLADRLNVNENYRAALSWSATDSTHVSLNANYSKNRSIPVADIDLSSYSAGLTGAIRLYSWLSLNMGVSHFRQISDGATGGNFIRNQAFINLTATLSEVKL